MPALFLCRFVLLLLAGWQHQASARTVAQAPLDMVTAAPVVLAATDPPAVLAVTPQEALPDQQLAPTVPAVTDPAGPNAAPLLLEPGAAGSTALSGPADLSLETATPVNDMPLPAQEYVVHTTKVSGGSTYCGRMKNDPLGGACVDKVPPNKQKQITCGVGTNMPHYTTDGRFVKADFE
jgi:hypothetical protein